MKTIWMMIVVVCFSFVGAIDYSAQPLTITQQLDETQQLGGSGKKDKKEDEKSRFNRHTQTPDLGYRD